MHPCCNNFLQTGTKIVAIVHLVLSILTCVLGILTLLGVGLLTASAVSQDKRNNEKGVYFTQKEYETIPGKEATAAVVGGVLIILAVIAIIVGAATLLFSILLFIGANRRNRTYCMIWFVVEVIFFILAVILLVIDVFSGESFGNIFMNLALLALNGYFLWVVWAFMKELKEEGTISPSANAKPRV